MSKIDDGGHAFPVCFEGGANSGEQPYFHEGMTLRDWFAGQCLSNVGGIWSDEESRSHYAEHCYLQADAMIAARAGA